MSGRPNTDHPKAYKPRDCLDRACFFGVERDNRGYGAAFLVQVHFQRRTACIVALQ
jgi:hypothetical protein